MSEIELKIAAKWAAMDDDGGWCAFIDKPSPRIHGWFTGGRGSTEGGADMGEIFGDIPYQGDWKDSLHQIISGKLVKYVDVPGDGEKVIVGPCNRKRYSAGRLNKEGHLLCYNGGDKWTSGGATSMWTTWRRPTPEELAE